MKKEFFLILIFTLIASAFVGGGFFVGAQSTPLPTFKVYNITDNAYPTVTGVSAMLIGNNVVITAEATDISGVSSMKAQIEDPSGNVITTLGNSGNGQAAMLLASGPTTSKGCAAKGTCSYYLSVNVSGWRGGTYHVNIFAADIYNNTSPTTVGKNYYHAVNFSLTSSKSSVATLNVLEVNGNSVAGFVADTPPTGPYNVQLPIGTIANPTIIATPTDSKASVIVPAAPTTGPETITVTAEAGNTLTYTINFTVATVPPKKNSAADLSDLQVNGNSFPLPPPTTNLVNESISGPINITVTPATPFGQNEKSITISINGGNAKTILSGSNNTVSISFGLTTVVIEVTAEDGIHTKDYSIYVNGLSNDATLKDLQVNNSTITGFNPNTTSYNIQQPFDTTATPKVTATTSNTNARLNIIQPASLTGTATVTVIAQDGTTEKYQVNFSIAPPNTGADLSDLQVNGMTLTNFSKTSYTNYVYLRIIGANIINVTPITPAGQNEKSITISMSSDSGNSYGSPTTVSSGSSNDKTVNFGNYVVKIEVTAQDGITNKDYEIYVLSTNDTLSELQINGTRVTGFTPGLQPVNPYASSYAYGTSPNVTYTITDPNAHASISQIATRATITVVSQSGTATATYIINFTITKVSLTATVSTPNKTYNGDATAPGTTCSFTGGVITGDNVTCSVGLVAFSDKNVGTGKTVTATGITLGGSSASNYTLSSASATTTANILAKPIHITPTSGLSKAVGDADPTFTFTNDSLIGSDSLSGALSRVAGETAGTYQITIGSLTASTNYTIYLEPVNFTIYAAVPAKITSFTVPEEIHTTTIVNSLTSNSSTDNQIWVFTMATVNLTTVVPTFITYSVDETVTVGGIPQTSGTTVQNFTIMPIIYTVASTDGHTPSRSYSVYIFRDPFSISSNSVTFGQQVTITATIPSAFYQAGEQVAFTDNIPSGKNTFTSSYFPLVLSGPTAIATYKFTPTFVGIDAIQCAFDTNSPIFLQNLSHTISLTVNKATPTLSGLSATAINYSQTLSKSTITGTATGATGNILMGGSFAFAVPSTVLNVGVNPNVPIIYTPSGGFLPYYNTANGNVSVTVNKATQTITTVATPSSLTYGQTATLSATGYLGTGTISYSSGSSTGCSVTGNTLYFTTASGFCTITASITADSNYNAATSAQLSVPLIK